MPCDPCEGFTMSVRAAGCVCFFVVFSPRAALPPRPPPPPPPSPSPLLLLLSKLPPPLPSPPLQPAPPLGQPLLAVALAVAEERPSAFRDGLTGDGDDAAAPPAPAECRRCSRERSDVKIEASPAAVEAASAAAAAAVDASAAAVAGARFPVAAAAVVGTSARASQATAAASSRGSKKVRGKKQKASACGGARSSKMRFSSRPSGALATSCCIAGKWFTQRRRTCGHDYKKKEEINH